MKKDGDRINEAIDRENYIFMLLKEFTSIFGNDANKVKV